MKPAPNSRVRMLQHPSHLHPHHLIHGRCVPQNIFMLEGVHHLVVGNFYLKMFFVRCVPPSQSNTNKVVLLLKEMFSGHCIPEVLHSDNGPQYGSAPFTDFCISWGITHEISSLHYPQSNGFAEACVKSIKHTLQQAKYSGANPHLALLAL